MSGFSPITFEEIGRDELNRLLVLWGHRMGPVRRPNRGWSHALLVGGDPAAVVATDRLIRERVAGFSRAEAVELSRLCASRPDLSRAILRLWRAFVFAELQARDGYSWAVSYQDAALHSGNLYRFDGWVRLGRSRSGVDARTGRQGRSKVIWGWCEDAGERRRMALHAGTSGGLPQPAVRGQERERRDGDRVAG